MISPTDRELAVCLIREAIASGAAKEKSCHILNIDVRTFNRWADKSTPIGDRRPEAIRPTPKNKISDEEAQIILEIVTSPEYQSAPPSQIVPKLADKGIYLASESTFYRVMKEAQLHNHRGRASKPANRPISTHRADGPNQVWMWDITWLPAAVKGLYYYLYLILDLYSRKIVGWEIWAEESAENASVLVRRAVMSEGCAVRQTPLVLHSDNGSPMKGSTLLETLYQLGITPSRSRPRVSNDNPYAESIFKTCKYRPSFPIKGFGNIEAARIWVLKFVRYYNSDHHHSGLNFLTPNQRHSGVDKEIFAKRDAVYKAAKEKHPERWSRNTRDWSLDDYVYLNPEKIATKELSVEKAG